MTRLPAANNRSVKRGFVFDSKKDSQIGVDFLPAVLLWRRCAPAAKKSRGNLASEFVEVDGQEAQVEALKDWVRNTACRKPPVFAWSPPRIAMSTRLRNPRSRMTR